MSGRSSDALRSYLVQNGSRIWGATTGPLHRLEAQQSHEKAETVQAQHCGIPAWVLAFVMGTNHDRCSGM